jgi:hypothetical protein
MELRLLSFETEARLADDFAFIAAAQEGVESVAAVYIEELTAPRGLVLRFAANEGVRDEIRNGLQQICDFLMSCASIGRHLAGFAIVIINLYSDRKKMVSLRFSPFQ